MRLYGAQFRQCLHTNVREFVNVNVNVREFLRRLRIETYLKDAIANRKETHALVVCCASHVTAARNISNRNI